MEIIELNKLKEGQQLSEEFLIELIEAKLTHLMNEAQGYILVLDSTLTINNRLEKLIDQYSNTNFFNQIILLNQSDANSKQ
jgi:signal recognition particle receptor subunit beta